MHAADAHVSGSYTIGVCGLGRIHTPWATWHRQNGTPLSAPFAMHELARKGAHRPECLRDSLACRLVSGVMPAGDFPANGKNQRE